MNWVDLLVIGVVFISMLIGVIRGLVKEALTLVSWATSIWVAWKFHPYLSPHLSGWIDDRALRVVAAVVVLFLLSLIVLTALSYLLTRLMEQTGLSGINRSLGALFGVARGALAISLVVILGTYTPIVHEQW